MACFPSRFQFREQSNWDRKSRNTKRERVSEWVKQKDRQCFPVRTSVRFFGKQREKICSHARRRSFPPPSFLPSFFHSFLSPQRLQISRYRKRSSHLCPSHPAALFYAIPIVMLTRIRPVPVRSHAQWRLNAEEKPGLATGWETWLFSA